MNSKQIKAILSEFETGPNYRLGQNFLVNPKVLDQIEEAAELSNEDTVLEVGPGLGVLTDVLAKRAGKVVSVEKDAKLMEIAQGLLSNHQNIEFINQDFLDFNVEKEFKETFKVVANLPYQISSPVIRKLLPNANLSMAVFLLQKEVAERICAKPGNSERGYLTVFTEFYAEPEIVAKVSKTSFWPVPKVESAVIKFVMKSDKPKVDEAKFFKLIQFGFSQKRKQLLNNIANSIRLPKEDTSTYLKSINIDPTRRAETLSLDEWLEIYKIFEKMF